MSCGDALGWTNGKTVRIFVMPGNPFLWSDTDFVSAEDLERYDVVGEDREADWVVLIDKGCVAPFPAEHYYRVVSSGW